MRQSVLALGLLTLLLGCGSDEESKNLTVSQMTGGTSGSGGGDVDAASGSGGTQASAGTGGIAGSTNSGGGGTAGATGGASGAGGAGLSPGTCVNSRDCAGNMDDKTICEPSTSRCVECVLAPDCPENNDCLANTCVPYTPCVNSLDCTNAPDGKTICDEQEGRCVQCVMDVDCGENRACLANECRTTCASDNDCTGMGLLCDMNVGLCVECTRHVDCAETSYCASGSCNPDLCAPGASVCDGNAVRVCTEVGDTFGAPMPCPFGMQCQNGVCGEGGGGGGDGGTCDPAQCPANCGVFSVPCCNTSDQCSCTNYPFLFCM